jgi:molybdopterin converting factor small subunit
MQVQVRLFAGLRQYLPPDSVGATCHLEVAAGATAADVLNQLGIPLDRREALAILVNGRASAGEQALQEGDVVAAFPAMAGG